MSPDEARLLAVQIAEPLITYIAGTKEGQHRQLVGSDIYDAIGEVFDLDKEDLAGFAYAVICELHVLLSNDLKHIFKHPEAYVTILSGHIQYYILKHEPKVRVFDQPMI